MYYGCSPDFKGGKASLIVEQEFNWTSYEYLVLPHTFMLIRNKHNQLDMNVNFNVGGTMDLSSASHLGKEFGKLKVGL